MSKKLKISFGVLLIISGLILLYLSIKGDNGIYFYIAQISVIVLSIINIIDVFIILSKK